MAYIHQSPFRPATLPQYHLPQVSGTKMGALLVWIAVLIYASSNSIVSLLVDLGIAHPVMGRNAITFCNLLLLGSLISLIPMTVLYRKDWSKNNLRKLGRKDWGILTLSAFLSSALTPGLFFYALEHTTVTNVVLVGRIEPPLFLLAAFYLLKERLNPFVVAGALVALMGAVLMISLNDGATLSSFGPGEWATVLATISFIASTIVARIGLKHVPMGIFAIYRTVLGAFLYFLIAMYLFGPGHFQDLLAPVVLKWVWIYAVIVIVLGQFAWNYGLKYARSSDVSLATSFSPLAALVFAMTLLGEDPGAGLIPGAVIILLGIFIGQYGRTKMRTHRRRANRRALTHESRLNFKGA